MAVTADEKKVSCSIKVITGTDDEGNNILKGVNLGSLSVEGFDRDKAYAVVELLKPCLAYSVDHMEETVNSWLNQSA